MKHIASPRRGFSTGACATAAAKAAALLLIGKPRKSVSLFLPWNSPEATNVDFPVVNREGGDGWASCAVVKDAGDDPDVTNGLEIRAAVHEMRGNGGCSVTTSGKKSVALKIEGGEGVGRVTKPGLAPPVGGPAINPVPLEMIERSVSEILENEKSCEGKAFRVVISVPDGKEAAKKTLNARLGIIGGISILGTTGIVIPTSIDAWLATIDASLDVAEANGCRQVVLSVGRSSEAAAQRLFPDLPPEAFVLIGDHAGYAFKAAGARKMQIILAGQFAKFCKIASGLLDTNVRNAGLDPSFMRKILLDAGFAGFDEIFDGNRVSARLIMEKILTPDDRGVFKMVTRKAAEVAASVVGVEVGAALFDYNKKCLARLDHESSIKTQR